MKGSLNVKRNESWNLERRIFRETSKTPRTCDVKEVWVVDGECQTSREFTRT
jgi:hypothetical protein